MTATQLNLLPIRIADSTLGSSASSFSFTSLPQVFSHLLVAIYVRSDHAVTADDVFVQFNSDTGANYYWQYVGGAGATAGASEGIGATSARVGLVAGSSAPTGSFGSASILIPHYTTSNEKSYVAQTACLAAASSGNMLIRALGGLWVGSGAISTITLTPTSGNFVTGSRVTIYGLA